MVWCIQVHDFLCAVIATDNSIMPQVYITDTLRLLDRFAAVRMQLRITPIHNPCMFLLNVVVFIVVGRWDKHGREILVEDRYHRSFFFLVSNQCDGSTAINNNIY
jgi:hypothetical protein